MTKFWTRHIDTIKAISQNNDSFFLYDCDSMAVHLNQINHDRIKLFYAVKANPLSCILKTVDKCGLGFDVASAGELRQVLKYKQNDKQVIATGPAKSAKYINEIAPHIDTFVIESPKQLEWLNQTTPTTTPNERSNEGKNKRKKCILRLQLQHSHQADCYNPLGGNNVTHFGVTPQDWLNIDISQYKNVEVIGLHTFQWGNVHSMEMLYQIWEYSVNCMLDLSSKMGIELQIVDLGGGIGIKYKESESTPTWQEVSLVINKIEQLIPKDTTIWLELGRYAVGEFGCYVATIVDRKVVDGTNILVLSGGANHIMRPAITKTQFPAFELFEESNKGARGDSKLNKAFHVYGPLCTQVDFMGKYYLNEGLTIGDKLVFTQCGAYGFTESMPFFLCHDIPAEFAIYKGALEHVRECTTSELWMK